MLRTVRAARYVLPFREGGSVPALVEGDDLGLYVVKLRGAGQGARALVAELIAGELARALGLAVPEIVLVEVDRALAASEPDPELCLPLEASVGCNLGLDYLPGSITFDPIVSPQPDATTASRTVLLDAFVLNVDRTPRNPNLLVWHARAPAHADGGPSASAPAKGGGRARSRLHGVWLIDHGASLYFHHGWTSADRLEGSEDPFAEARHHVLLPWAAALPEAAAHLVAAFTGEAIDRIVADLPAAWLGAGYGFADDVSHRAAYAAWLRARVRAVPALLEEAERARALRV